MRLVLHRNRDTVLRPNTDRRDLPRYTYVEVARYLRLPASTVWAWFFGQPNFDPFLVPADRNRHRLSFYNLVEAHALSWTKEKYPTLRPQRIRAALEYVREVFPNYVRPLVTRKFSTDGKFLFINSIAQADSKQTINASEWGQLLLPTFDEVLDLIEYDDEELASLLYPKSGHRFVVINPRLSSGRPVIKGTGVLASIIWQRAIKAKEPLDRLKRDYNLNSSEIEAAINYFEAA